MQNCGQSEKRTKTQLGKKGLKAPRLVSRRSGAGASRRPRPRFTLLRNYNLMASIDFTCCCTGGRTATVPHWSRPTLMGGNEGQVGGRRPHTTINISAAIN